MTISDGESSAVKSIHTIQTLQAQYASQNQGSFAVNFDELIELVSLDEQFKGKQPVVNGYVFTMNVEKASETKKDFYRINADPQIMDDPPKAKHYYADSNLEGIKYTEEKRQARVYDPTI